MTRAEFPKSVRLAAWNRCGGRCETCGNKIISGNGPHYDHIVPAAIGGPATLNNCRVLCIKPCHKGKTEQVDVPEIAKSARIFEKRIGARKTSRPMAGSKASGFRKRMSGAVERR